MFGLDDLKQTRYFQDVMQEGSLKTAREAVLNVLEARFNNKPSGIAEKLNKIDDLSCLSELLKKAVTVSNVAEFKQALKEVMGNE